MSLNVPVKQKKIQLFINSDGELCDPLVKFLQKWADDRKMADSKIKVLSVLDNPVEVVRYQLFHTPALVIDGVVAGINLRTVEALADLLP